MPLLLLMMMFFYDDDDDDDDLFDSSYLKRRSLVFGRDENTPRPHFVSFLCNRCSKSETTCDDDDDECSFLNDFYQEIEER